jgi:hypothetical protein
MVELEGVLVVDDVAVARTSMLVDEQTCVGPELPLTYARLPAVDIHWTPNSQSLPLFGVVVSHTTTGWVPVGVPAPMVKVAFSCGGFRTAG